MSFIKITDFSRPKWMPGDFHGGKNMNDLYSRNTQRETIERILGSQELADFYIHPGDDLYYLCK